MEQQRTRRYKSHYLATLPFMEKKTRWNTASITPGTNFMNMLTASISREFEKKESTYGVSEIIVSGSTSPGEGEHKMYQHLRDTANLHDNVAIYGLDSDLIMLSIFHTVHCKNIYIFRESPVFGDINKQKNPADSNLPLFLNVSMLMRSISVEMGCSSSYDKRRVFDYVFLCFFLGNDFLPHFPALNIRTHGIQVLLDTYRNIIAKKNEYIISHNGQYIIWKNVYLLIQDLAKNEHSLLLQEYDVRAKWDKRYWPEKTPKEKEELINNVPVIYRAEEKYICPDEPHWEDRYYSALFHNRRTLELGTSTARYNSGNVRLLSGDGVSQDNIINTSLETRPICINYLEGLEWVFKYYTRGCPDWKWKYNYHYPPLLSDLVRYVPHGGREFIRPNKHTPFSPYAQLSYVLPPAQFVLLPDQIREYLETHYSEVYNKRLEFQWAFCRYFWEAHNVNTPISLRDLERLDAHFTASS
jgi:5'-3' exonuclease